MAEMAMGGNMPGGVNPRTGTPEGGWADMVDDVHHIYEMVEDMKEDSDMGNGTEYSSSGFGHGFGGGGNGFWNGGGNNGVGLVGLVGINDLGDRRRGDDDCGDKFILNKLHDNARDIWETRSHAAEQIGESKAAFNERIGVVHAELKGAAAKLDCVGEKVDHSLDKADRMHDNFCNHRADVAREFGEVRYRDLEHKGELMRYIDCVTDKLGCKIESLHHHVDQQFCDLRLREETREKEYWKSQAEQERRCRDQDKADFTNVNFGTQLNDLSKMINSLKVA